MRSRNGFEGQEPGGSAGHAGARAEGGECGGGQARTERFRGLADPTIWGREGKVPGRGRQRRELGGVFVGWRLQISGSEPDKKMILSFFGAGSGRGGSLVGGDRGGSWGRVVRSGAQGGGSGGGQGRGDRGKGVEGGVVRSRNAFRGQEPGGSAGHAGARAEGGGCGGGVVKTTSRVRGFPGARPQRRGRRIIVIIYKLYIYIYISMLYIYIYI